MKKKITLVVHFLLLLILLVGGIAVHRTVMAQVSTGNVTGWAWSDNIGWVSFNCSDVSDLCTTASYGVDADPDTGALSGYAWSESVGWLSFNPGDTGGCPDGTNCEAKVDFATGKITGYARFCSATANGNCTGGIGPDGWDGWLKLSSPGSPSLSSPVLDGSQGATYDANTTKIMGYGWGGDVVGWLKFNNSYNGVKITIDVNNLKCKIDETEFDLNTFITRYKTGVATSTEACESYSSTCEQVTPTEADWNTDITPIADGTYSYSTCTVSSSTSCAEGNNPCDISAYTQGTNLGQTMSCGEQRKFYKQKVVVNNAAGTISCESNGNAAVRVCDNGVLTGDSSFNKVICRVNPYQKER
ncbi:MAG: hypothetical protein RL094_163 [Candidatus Parcubacteria bacterium]|jgi:hypothetical protein